MENNITHIQQLRAQYAYNRKQVLWLTGMTDEELSGFQLDTGMDWLTHYTCEAKYLLEQLMREPMIWRWWINEWNLRDDALYLAQLYRFGGKEANAMYRSMHQAVFIHGNPPYCVLEHSYAKAIGELNDELQKIR